MRGERPSRRTPPHAEARWCEGRGRRVGRRSTTASADGSGEAPLPILSAPRLAGTHKQGAPETPFGFALRNPPSRPPEISSTAHPRRTPLHTPCPVPLVLRSSPRDDTRTPFLSQPLSHSPRNAAFGHSLPRCGPPLFAGLTQAQKATPRSGRREGVEVRRKGITAGARGVWEELRKVGRGREGGRERTRRPARLLASRLPPGGACLRPLRRDPRGKALRCAPNARRRRSARPIRVAASSSGRGVARNAETRRPRGRLFACGWVAVTPRCAPRGRPIAGPGRSRGF